MLVCAHDNVVIAIANDKFRSIQTPAPRFAGRRTLTVAGRIFTMSSFYFTEVRVGAFTQNIEQRIAENNSKSHTHAIISLNSLSWLFWRPHFANYQMALVAVTAILSAV